VYPPEAKQNQIQRKVVLALTIDKAGRQRLRLIHKIIL
jgi:hypothetical protein